MQKGKRPAWDLYLIVDDEVLDSFERSQRETSFHAAPQNDGLMLPFPSWLLLCMLSLQLQILGHSDRSLAHPGGANVGGNAFTYKPV